MFIDLCKTALLCSALSLSSVAAAAPVVFVPPNDVIGADYQPSNDSWAMGRGIVFGVATAQSLTGVGLLHDLSAIDLSFGVYEVEKSANTLARLALLASGGGNVTSNGREWIDYRFGAVRLEAGKQYLVEFAFEGNPNRNFYFDNQNIPWDQGAFTGLDGTLGPELNNFVVAGFRIEAVPVNAIPEPASLALLGAGAVAFSMRRRSFRASH